jgi:PAS domain-containing protein
MASAGPKIELILARNFVALIHTPAFVVDPDGVVTFFNEAAGRLIGRRFEESGRLSRDEWDEIGPLDEQGRPTASDPLPLTVALREGRPASGSFRIGTDQGALLQVEASAMPLLRDGSVHGALVMFGPAPGANRDQRLPLRPGDKPVSPDVARGAGG